MDTNNTPETTPLVVGFAGAKQSGKSTITQILMAKHGVVGMGFAQPLRTFIGDLLGLPQDVLEEVKEEQVPGLRAGVTPRYLMQTLGTEWGRTLIDPDLWVKVAMRDAINALERGYAVAFADVRFANEAEAIRNLGGVIIEIVRPGTAIDPHVSEKGLPRELIDDTVTNDGTPQELYNRVLDVLKARQVRRQIEASAGARA